MSEQNLKTGKTAHTAREMNKHKGLNETHWTGTGKLRLSTRETTALRTHPDVLYMEGVG